MISVCLATESGDIISKVGGDTTATLNSLQQVITDMTAFDSATLSSNLDTQWLNLKNKIDDYIAGNTFDFSSTTDVNVL